MTTNGFQVLVDGPPVLSLADSMILSARVDGVLLIISERETTRESCRGSITRLTACGGKLIGVVLQKARFPHVRNYVPQYPMMQNGTPAQSL
jgi:succinoglycan biosynthesis transport protein ExoP